jgi:Protein of unknown function (DUF3306)
MVDKMAQHDDGGFLSRWSQRKQALREGKPLVEPELPAVAESSKENLPLPPVTSSKNAPDLVANQAPESVAEALPPAPTMRDVHELTPQSDFKPFMRADVAPEVKNAAMKQLFKDPHFNVMDMMDIYVDDYSKPDPLPPEMLRQMAVTKFLGFWEEEEKEAAEKKAREDAQRQAGQNVAQSEPVIIDEKAATPEQVATETPAASAQAEANTHDHTDLQLQPDDAAGREGAPRSAG